MDTQTVLLVEDDPHIAELLDINLRDLGLNLDWVDTGSEGRDRLVRHSYALVILDLMLPGIDGLELCRQLRARDSKTPVLMLTAKSEELDKVLGLEIGADDYITKPFSLRELLARIRVALRRVRTAQEPATRSGQPDVIRGSLHISPIKRKVTLDGDPVDLTAKEFDLLLLFASHPGRAYSRRDLLHQVWGYQYDGYEHTVNAHINRLRSKIEGDPSNPRYIQTVWGVGYRFRETEEERA